MNARLKKYLHENNEKIITDAIVVFAFAITAFFVAGQIVTTYLNGDIVDPRPPVSVTFDNFYHNYYVHYASSTGSPSLWPQNWIGDIPAYTEQPPGYYYLGVAFTQISGINSYVAPFLYSLLTWIFFLLGIALLIRKYISPSVAVLTLGLSAIIPASRLFLFQLGYSLDIQSIVFLPAFIFFVFYFFEKKSYNELLVPGLLVGLLLGSSFLSHVIESFFATIFAGIYFVYLLATKNVRREHFVAGLSSLAVFGLLLSFAIPFFFPYTSQPIVRLGEFHPPFEYFPEITLPVIVVMLSILGLLLSVVEWKKITASPQTLFLMLFPLYMYAAAHAYYVGFLGGYTYRMGYQFFILFGLYAAIALSYTKNVVGKKYAIFAIPCVFIIVLSFCFAQYPIQPIEYRIHDDQTWETISWIRENTPKDALVFSLNSFIHEAQMYDERYNFKGDLNIPTNLINVESLCNETFPDRFQAHLPVMTSINRTGLFSSQRLNATVTFADGSVHYVNELRKTGTPIEGFDYVIARYAVPYHPCIQYFMTEATKRGFSIVWNNDVDVILHNDKSIK